MQSNLTPYPIMFAKKYLTSLIIFLLVNDVLAQASFNQELAPKLPVVSSPEASTITSIVDNPVDYKTGIPDITIPLFDLTTGDITIPIRIRHSGSGIKLRELASPVGLGWSLDAGGVISSVINGGPGSLTFSTESEIVDYFGTQNPQTIYRTDHEPDYFHYSFLGNSGKFVFDNERNGYTVPASPLYIDGTDTTTIVVKDKQGYIFSFNDVELISVTNTCPGGDIWAPGQVANASYYLSTVRSPSNKEVNFFYKSYSYSYYSDVSQSRNFSEESIPTNPAPSTCWTKNIIHEGKVIDSIASDNGYSVKFFYSASRGDLPVGNNLGRLEKVVVYFQQKVLKTFDLTHTFTLGTSPILSIVPPDFYSGNHVGNSRMMLTKIQEAGMEPYTFGYNMTYKPGRFNIGMDHWGYYNGKETNESLIPFGFDYMIGVDRGASEEHAKAFTLKTITYPTKGVRTFNYELNKVKLNSTENPETEFFLKDGVVSCLGNSSVEETVYVPSIAYIGRVRLLYWTNSTRTQDIQQEEGQPFSRTTISWTDNGVYQSMLLTGNGTKDGYYDVDLEPGINYTVSIETAGSVNGQPVSTHVRFVWLEEIFQSLNVSETNVACGGLRIKSIISDGGVVEDSPSFIYEYASHEDSIKFRRPTYWYYTYKHDDTHLATPDQIYRRTSSSINPLPIVLYDFVRVYQVNAEGETNGKTEYTYFNWMNRIHTVPGSSLYAETDDSWLSGDMIKSRQFKRIGGAFELIQETEFTYEIEADASTFYVDNLAPNEFNIYSIKSAMKVPEYVAPLIFIAPVYTFEVYKIWGGFKYLKQQVQKNYLNGLSSAVTTSYIYDLNKQTLKKEIVSGNRTLLTEYKRVSDVQAFSGSVIESMQQAGITEPVVEVRKFEVGSVNKLLSGFFVNYGSIGPISSNYYYKPFSVHSMVLSQPLNVSFNYLLESSFTNEQGIEMAYQNYYEEEAAYKYDSDLNIVQVKNRSGISKSFIYDAFNQLVAICDNSNVSEIYFTNFEEENSSGCLVNGLKAKSGTKVHCGDTYTMPLSYQPQSPTQLEMSYWYLQNNEWTYSGALSYSSTLTAPIGSIAIDDVRIHPKQSHFISYSYDSGRGINSQSDVNSVYQFYEYDQFGRLRFVFDKDGKVIQENEIHYKVGQFLRN